MHIHQCIDTLINNNSNMLASYKKALCPCQFKTLHVIFTYGLSLLVTTNLHNALHSFL